MAADDSAPATKADIKLLMDSQATLLDDIEQWKREVMDHFDFVAENIRHDLKGANRDEVETLKNTTGDHEERIANLELRPV